jgi:5-methylcytosine-specific restriction endonuclease McrA
MSNDTAAAIASEQDAVALLRAFLRENAEALLPISRWGDGCAGYMAEVIFEELGIVRRSTTVHKKARISRTLATRVFERDAYRCVHCGGHHDLCCDHVIPEANGGEATFENLQTLCRPCNSRKGAR